MLTVSRKLGQKIVLDGGRIVITAVRGGAQTIRIGVDAPREVEIETLEDHCRRRGLEYPCTARDVIAACTTKGTA